MSGKVGGNQYFEDPQAKWRHDQGSADSNLIRALQQGDSSLVVEALISARVLVALAKSTLIPSVHDHAVHDHAVHDHAVHDQGGGKTSDMSIVCLTASDGRVGLLVFTSVESMKMWNTEARPIPIAGRDAGIAALDESASALIIDPAGPIPFTLTLPDLVALTGVDQRWRAVILIEQVLEAAEIDLPVFTLPEKGPLVIGARAGLAERIAHVLDGEEISMHLPRMESLLK